MVSNREIIKRAGGPEAVADATRSTSHVVKVDAVWKWYRNGIPSEHWPLLIKMSGVSLQEIYDANTEKPRRRGRQRPNQSEAAA